jgi:hypothetical protein
MTVLPSHAGRETWPQRDEDAISDLHLVLANMRVLFDLVTTRPSRVGDGAVGDRPRAIGDR